MAAGEGRDDGEWGRQVENGRDERRDGENGGREAGRRVREAGKKVREQVREENVRTPQSKNTNHRERLP